jgi:class 3 adenylate cyclase
MAVTPATRYAKSGDVHIAYQVVGGGANDLVFVPGWVSHVEYAWEDPSYSDFLKRLASFARLILLDRRGTGLSDRVAELPTLEQRMDDVRAVMDVAGSERAAVFGISEGGAMCMTFAATYRAHLGAHPVRHLREGWRAPDYPIGAPEFATARFLGARRSGAGHGRDQRRALRAQPGLGRALSPIVRRGSEALSVSLGNPRLDPHAPPTLTRAVSSRPLVSRRSSFISGRSHEPSPWRSMLRRAHSRRESSSSCGRRSLLHLGGRHGGRFSAGRGVPHWRARPGSEPDRVLATVMFTDIVHATETAAGLGDARWRGLLEGHHALVRDQLARFRGREIDTAGDGFLASFDGPARAVRCATAVSREVRRLGLEVRAGLHTGECEVMGEKLGGIAVHTGARVASLAAAGEVLVSGSVKDLVAGSGITFVERGTHTLKGVPGTWPLYAVTSA